MQGRLSRRGSGDGSRVRTPKPAIGRDNTNNTRSAADTPHSVGCGLRVAYLPDPNKFGVKKGYPLPGVRDRLLEGHFQFNIVTSAFVRSDGLTRGGYHVLVVPGGFAPNYAAALGELGGRKIREFLAAGGGYVGICAGAYLGSAWGFDLLPVDMLDIDHWDRGKTDGCRLRLTPAGQRWVGTSLPETITVRYANGPLFQVLDSRVETLATFESQLLGKHGTHPPLMRGSPAVLAGSHMRGRVVLISPHIEDKPIHGDFFRMLFHWAASSPQPSSVRAHFQPFQLKGNTLVARSELIVFLKSLDKAWGDDRIESLLEASGADEADQINIADFVNWIFDHEAGDEVVSFQSMLNSNPLEDALPAPPESVGTDGEECGMNVPSLVRLRSFAEFGYDACIVMPSSSGEGSPNSTLSTHHLAFTASTCSRKFRQVPSTEVEASIVKIQRSLRSRMVTVNQSPPSHNHKYHPQKHVELPTSRGRVITPWVKTKQPIAPSEGPMLKKTGCDYIFWLQGSILFSAPHSLKLLKKRSSCEPSRNHKCERWTAEIAVVLARELHRVGLPASMMIWNRAVKPNCERLDPNFLEARQFADSPWHRGLHRWVSSASRYGLPLLHIDLHGKVSEKKHLDLGTVPLEEVWSPNEMTFISALKRHLSTSLNAALKKCLVQTDKGTLIQVNTDPRLSGFWGHDTVTTISHQSVLLGVPAVQFEMPLRLREQIVHNHEMCVLLAQSLARAYHEVVVPWWNQRSEAGQPFFNPTFAADVVESGPVKASGFEKWSTELLDELVHLDRATIGLECQI